jgi:hypothetical protein
MSVAEAFDQLARVRHTVDREYEWPASIDPRALTLNTWIGDVHVQLSRDLLEQVITKGQIAGDERKIIGQNDDGELVVLWFDAKPSVWERY